MTDDNRQAGASQSECGDDKGSRLEEAPKRITAITSWTPITKRGQKYVGPVGRHSQQTHRRALERASAGGHASAKELHAHDRNLVETELKRLADLRVQQLSSSKKATV